MAEWAEELDRSVARVLHPNAAYGALATLIRGATAITPAFVVDRLTPDDVLQLEFVGFPSVTATVAQIIPEQGFAFLEVHDTTGKLRPLPTAYATPPVGAKWTSFVITKDGEAGRVTGRVTGMGAIDGRVHLTLEAEERGDLLEQGSAGAPVVVNRRLVAVLVGGSAERWNALPIPRGESTGGDPVVTRLTTASRRVLARAEGIRVVKGDDKVHTSALAAGLLSETEGPVTRAFRAAGIDWSGLRALTRGALPDPDAFRPVPVTTIPERSSHVEAAMAAAFERAATRGALVQTSDLLAGLLSIEECSLGKRLRDAGLDRYLAQQLTADARPIADYRSDAVAGRDALDIQKDVRILASVLVAKEVEPPLALGLFGEWGSGKSFFMRELAKHIELLKQDARRSGGTSAFCENVVQLTFNAWSYIDTNLWASLTSEIFEGLARELDREAFGDVDHPRQRLLAAAASTRNVLDEAQRAKSLAEADLRASEERLAELREQAGRSPKTIARAAYRVAVQQPEVRQTVEDAAQQVGLPPDRLLELGDQRAPFLRTLAEAVRHRRFAVTVLAVAALAVVLAVVFGRALAAVTAAVGGAALAVVPLLPLVSRAVTLTRQARVAAGDEIGRATRSMEQQRNSAAAKVAEAGERVEEAAERVATLSRELEELRADREMSEFVRQRTLSEDYSRHLGVISRARKDFEELSRLLKAVRSEGPYDGPRLPKIDRIVLYIDDLDRCPEPKVADVIQAVHLLLAFPLFVVVVGVDARWLLHSLQQFSPAFQSTGDGDDAEATHWQSTPLNYLEKIFQIPFTLRPMSETGFSSLVDSVTTTATRTSSAAPPVVPDDAGDGKVEPPSTPGAVQPETEPEPEPAPAPEPEPEQPVDRDPGFLHFEPFELACLKQLYPLVPSPRAAKRLVNVYRLIRAGIPEAAREEFIGDETRGNHRAVLLLLAVVSSYPAEGGELLRELIVEEHDGTWWDFIDSFTPGTERWQEVRERLERVRDLVADDEPCATVAGWAPEVARFSFYSGRVFAPVVQREGDSESSVNSESST